MTAHWRRTDKDRERENWIQWRLQCVHGANKNRDGGGIVAMRPANVVVFIVVVVSSRRRRDGAVRERINAIYKADSMGKKVGEDILKCL